jgi:hypothetical protein
MHAAGRGCKCCGGLTGVGLSISWSRKRSRRGTHMDGQAGPGGRAGGRPRAAHSARKVSLPRDSLIEGLARRRELQQMGRRACRRGSCMRACSLQRRRQTRGSPPYAAAPSPLLHCNAPTSNRSRHPVLRQAQLQVLKGELQPRKDRPQLRLRRRDAAGRRPGTARGAARRARPAVRRRLRVHALRRAQRAVRQGPGERSERRRAGARAAARRAGLQAGQAAGCGVRPAARFPTSPVRIHPPAPAFSRRRGAPQPPARALRPAHQARHLAPRRDPC